MKQAVLLAGVLVLGVAACSDSTAPIDRPENLWYQLEPSGDPDHPQGVVLRWDPVLDADLELYNVYGRLDGSGQFDLRGTTTSPSFHDNGDPDAEYTVSAVNTDGEESEFAESVVIDERLRLESPNDIWSYSLDGAILVAWADNPYLAEPEGFDTYRVYSSTYDLDAGLCGDTWFLEGTTIAPEFLSSALTNGVSRCLAVSAVSIEGWESLWSDAVADTPRPEARNVFMTPVEQDPSTAEFRFFENLNGDGFVDDNELGLVRDNTAVNDFRLTRSGTTIFIEMARSATIVALYSASPIDDLTDIDVAPVSGYSAAAISAEPGFGYVFEIDEGDGFLRYGALRMTHVGQDFVLFDWSYQTDPGNPQLLIRGGLPTVSAKGLVITGRH